MAWDWLEPTLDAFLTSAGDQQVHLVETFFQELDFRRFQVDLKADYRKKGLLWYSTFAVPRSLSMRFFAALGITNWNSYDQIRVL